MADDKMEDIFTIPEDIVFPDELNRYLKDQIAAYAEENAILRKNIDEYEQKCIQAQKETEDLKKKLKEIENPLMPPFVSTTQTINAKIIELSKNYRDKCAELEKYKTKCSKLQSYFEELKRSENEEKQQRTKPASNPNLTKPNDETTTSELKQMQEKLNATTSKMLEFKNANMQLKNELRQTNRLLQQEVGEDPNSLRLNGGWKGRAQIICDLQEKNRKLKEKMRKAQEQGISATEIPNNSEKISTKILTLERENVELKSQNDAHKMKIESLKSRCNMLETEHHDLKQKIQNEKNRNAKDLELIATISNQLAEAEQNKKNAIKEKDMEINKLKTEIHNLKSQTENYKVLIDNLKARKDTPSVTSKDEHVRDFEDEKLKLLDLVDVYKKRLDNERTDREKVQHLYRLEKQRAMKLEFAVAKSELESATTNRSGYSSISQASLRATEENFQNQLELAKENIKALQTRLQLEQNERKQDLQEFAKILTTKMSNKTEE